VRSRWFVVALAGSTPGRRARWPGIGGRSPRSSASATASASSASRARKSARSVSTAPILDDTDARPWQFAPGLDGEPYGRRPAAERLVATGRIRRRARSALPCTGSDDQQERQGEPNSELRRPDRDAWPGLRGGGIHVEVATWSAPANSRGTIRVRSPRTREATASS